MKFSNKLILIIISLISSASQLWATDNYKEIVFSTNDNNGIIVNENTIDGTTIKFSWQSLTASEIETSKGTFTKISLKDLENPNGKGEPEVPMLNYVIETPVNAKVNVQILSYEKIVISLADHGFYNQVIPAQPRRTTSTNAKDVDFIYDYSNYIISPDPKKEIAKFDKSAIMRDIQIGNIKINPISYNPITNEVTIFNDLKIKISYEGGITSNKSKRSKILLENSPIQKLQSPATAATSYDKAINYVIVSPREFESTLASFVQWKTEKGFNVTEAYTDQSNVGSSLSTIKSYLKGLYDNEATRPDYLLLVGDIDQMPSWTNKQNFNNSGDDYVTDLYYAEFTDDYLPEYYYSRVSANNTSELSAQLDKIIAYEKYELEDTAYLEKALFVAGLDDDFGYFYGNTSINYVKDNYLDEFFDKEYFYFDISTSGTLPSGTGSQSISASSANGALDDILDNFDNGLGLTSYAGHCSQYGWGDPQWVTNNVNARSNNGKYTVMLNNCCLVGRFEEETNFAEKMMRLEDRGAVAFIGATNSSYWRSDFTWRVGYMRYQTDTPEPTYANTKQGAFDALFHTNDEAYENQATTLGELLTLGNLSTNNIGEEEGSYYFEIYHIFGDASMMAYIGTPKAMSISNPSSIYPDSNSIKIEAIPGAYVGLSVDGVLIDGGSADNNSGIFNADLSNTTLAASQVVKLVVTAPNKQPYFADITVAESNTPNIAISGTTNEDISPNSNILLDLVAENLATSGENATASNVVVTLESSDEYTIVSNNKNIGDLTASQTKTIDDALEIKLSSNLSDQSEVVVNGNATSGSDSWSFQIKLTVSIPKLEITKLELLNNSNTEINPGESGNASFTITNSGSQAITNVSLTTTINKVGLTLGTLPANFTLAAGASKVIQVPIDVDSDVIIGASFSFNTTVQSGVYSTTTEIIGNVGKFTEHLFTKSEEITTCFATIYDDGGADDDYSSLFDNTLIIKPISENLKIKATFESFNTETDFDSLWVYSGNDNNKTLIVTLTGDTLYKDDIISEASDGSISIRLKSDQYETEYGFKINIGCIDPDSNDVTNLVLDDNFDNTKMSINLSKNQLNIIGNYQGLAEIYSITGEKVLINNQFNPNTPINIKGLKSGAYILRLTNGKTFSFVKIQQ